MTASVPAGTDDARKGMNALPEKMRARIAVTETGCWEWQGARVKNRYGSLRLNIDGEWRGWLAHRYAWTLINGAIPDGLNLCHRCDNPPCVNPDHLFLGTQLDNVRDMDAKGRRRTPHAGRTRCQRGHLLAGDNLKVDEGTGWRRCRTCENARNAARRRRVVTCPTCGDASTVGTFQRHLTSARHAAVAAGLADEEGRRG